MDASMDIDMDLDLGPLPEPEVIETEQTLHTFTTTTDGSVVDPQTAEAQYDKVHIRGVDELATDNIKQFAISHFPLEQPSRIEWIDDTSANIVYSTPEIGLQALAALTHDGELEPNGDGATLTAAGEIPALRLRSAKVLASHPDSVLQVRSAVKADKKKPRAHEASRFYMMHPEHDPRERVRNEFASDRRRSRGGESDGDYRRRRFDDRELRRRRDRDHEENRFSANMYDDSGPASADQSDGDRGRRRGRSGRREQRKPDLFSKDSSVSGRLRNRSESPGRDTLMQEGGYIDEKQESRRRFRERSPQPARRNQGRELFASDSDSRELFPNKTADTYLKKELFPSKVSNHRRSDAIDAADETADLFARRISIPLVDGAHDTDPGRNRNVELFPSSKSSGVNIRGAARNEDQGYAIRGAANNGISIKGRGGAAVRELFPSKFNNSNAGKELFTDKLEGRGGPRRRAEDMFT
ncbi:hypothetical protein BJX66DRAFT_295928 [Aspergillus keveii]|uniref:Uncharacterized protein n=1 Tax=Aspergillus keveii TaxID=714993 RepID=A0ABR4GGQ0_9EURO